MRCCWLCGLPSAFLPLQQLASSRPIPPLISRRCIPSIVWIADPVDGEARAFLQRSASAFPSSVWSQWSGSWSVAFSRLPFHQALCSLAGLIGESRFLFSRVLFVIFLHPSLPLFIRWRRNSPRTP